MTRQCGDCNLCCKLLPVRSLDKGANEKCRHQSYARGCKVYANLARVSPECRLWSCRYLLNSDTADLNRPDRSGYVVDPSPNYIEMEDNETKERVPIQVVQIWVDPKHPDAHRDPALRAYLRRRGAEGLAAIIRYNETDGFVLFPPEMTGEPDFVARGSTPTREEHSPDDILRTLGMGVFEDVVAEAGITEDSPALQAYMERKEP
jgi:hypothetical protein